MKMEKKRNGIIRRSREERISCGGKKTGEASAASAKTGQVSKFGGVLISLLGASGIIIDIKTKKRNP